MRKMPTDRPPRPPTGEVDEAVRRTILRQIYDELGLSASAVLSLHTIGDHLPDASFLLRDVERRYQLRAGRLEERIAVRALGAAGPALLSDTNTITKLVVTDHGAPFVLLELPETEFLTAIEHAVALGYQRRLFGVSDEYSGTNSAYSLAASFFRYADEVLAAHGVPYRRVAEEWCFEWVGDPKQHELVVGPALQALDDRRLAGARDEFDEALRKRRLGTPKDLEDAVDEAAKSVESVLKVIHDERAVPRPRNEAVSGLFESLKDARCFPAYVVNLVTAAAGPRNKMAAHGQGATVRAVPEELAEASIAAAATAITFLAHYLP